MMMMLQLTNDDDDNNDVKKWPNQQLTSNPNNTRKEAVSLDNDYCDIDDDNDANNVDYAYYIASMIMTCCRRKYIDTYIHILEM